MVFTRMPSGASSMAGLLARPDIAARKVLERMRFSMGCLMDEDAMLTMRPPPRSRIRGSALPIHADEAQQDKLEPGLPAFVVEVVEGAGGRAAGVVRAVKSYNTLERRRVGTVGDGVIGPLGRQQLGDVPLETPGDAGVAVAVDLHVQPAIGRRIAHLPYCAFFAVAWCRNFRKRS